MRFTIDRATWRCGGKDGHASARGRGKSQLLNAEGYLCCLGQISLQLGATQEEILQIASPEDTRPELGCDLSLLRLKSKHHASYEPTELADNAMIVNDDDKLNDHERERELAELFEGHGYSLVFVGEYVSRNVDGVDAQSAL